jgi:hypothetical protein
MSPNSGLANNQVKKKNPIRSLKHVADIDAR